MKRLLWLIAAAVAMAAIGMGTTGTASAANPAPSDKHAPVVATIVSCNGLGLVNFSLQYLFCGTTAVTPGTAYFDTSGTYMSEGTGGTKTDSAMAAGWSSNGPVDGLIDTTVPSPICIGTNVSSFHHSGKGAYGKQMLFVSWNDSNGYEQQSVASWDAQQVVRPYCSDSLPAGAWDVWWTFISEVGGQKGAKTSLAETLVSAPGFP